MSIVLEDSNLNVAEQVNVLFKSSLGFPSTKESTPWFQETSVKYNNYVNGEEILLDEIPSNPSFSVTPNLVDVNVSSSQLATGGYIKEDSTRVIRQYHRLILTPVPNSSNNSYYALDSEGNNILTDGLQFNTKWSGSGNKIYPYTLYTQAFINADSNAPNELGQDSTGGNWLYDLKNGVIFFPDYSSSLCNGTTNKPVFSFYKYIGRKGIVKQIDFKNSLLDIPNTTKKYDKQIVVQTSDNTIHRYDSSTSSWIPIGGSGGGVWEESSSNSNIFYNGSGNVGIGTDSPANKLEVNGSIKMSNWNNQFVMGDTNWGFKNTNSGSDYYIDCRINGTAAQGPNRGFRIHNTYNNQENYLFTVTTAGNVGIGTETPGYKLDVRGYMSVYNQFHSGNYSGAEYYQSIIYLGGNEYSPQIRVKRRSGYSDKTDLEFWVSGVNVAARHAMTIKGHDGYGNVGIGTTSPNQKLHVSGTARITGGIYVEGVVPDYNNIWSQQAYIQDSNGHHIQHFGASDQWRVGMKVTYSIWCLGVIGASSDERIKENIAEIDDSYSLQKVRDISCVWYNYKDKLSRGNGKVAGFIAQQVKEHIPEAVSVQNGVIPNEMRNLKDISWNGTVMSCDLGDVSGVKYRFYVSNDLSGNDEEMKEIVGNEDNTFTFDASYNNVFCYGREVDDFNILDKQKLFALNFSATQEIDRIQQQQLIDISGNTLGIQSNKNELELLKLENQELTNKVTSLETELNNLKTIVESLVNNN